MEAAQQILDRVIITPPLKRTFAAAEVSAQPVGELPIYRRRRYEVRVAVRTATSRPKLRSKWMAPRSAHSERRPAIRSGPARRSGPRSHGAGEPGARLAHAVGGRPGVAVASSTADHAAEADGSAREARRALSPVRHGTGRAPLQPRKAARQILETLAAEGVPQARRAAEVDRFLALYDRAAERGDPYEERVKLALKAVLVWPEFLFRIEKKHDEAGHLSAGPVRAGVAALLFPLVHHARRDADRLAAQGRLQDPKVLAAQVERMLDDPRSRTFVNTFIGQWLGTQEIGGRVVPLLTELQSYYTPEVAADLRAEPILLFDRILGENRSLLELLTANYTHLTERLVKFYQTRRPGEGRRRQRVPPGGVAGQPARRRDRPGRRAGDDVAL